MATRKQTLGLIVALFALAGVIAASFPLFMSLNPNTKAKANVRTFEKKAVAVGTLKIFRQNDFALVVARPQEDSFVLFSTGYVDNLRNPYYFIWPGGVECVAFSLVENTIQCDGLGGFTMSWNLDGSPVEGSLGRTVQLELLPYRITGASVRYGAGA